MSDNESNMEEFLRNLLGEQAARAAMESMRARGIDPESLNSQFPDPEVMRQALTQFSIMMNRPSARSVEGMGFTRNCGDCRSSTARP